MPAIKRRAYNFADAISQQQGLVAANDLDGTASTRRAIFVDGNTRVIIFQDNDGTAGTTGIDVVCVSNDGGVTWAPEPNTGLAINSDDTAGTVLAGGALNAAGVEPTTVKASLFKFGPFEQPCYLRIARKNTVTGAAAWTTGAPSVLAFLVGPNGGGALATITHTAD